MHELEHKINILVTMALISGGALLWLAYVIL